MRAERPPLVGNRLALAGAVIYLLEWVGILGFGPHVTGAQGAKPADIVAQYTQHGTGIALLAGWLSLVLLGRILFVAGIRDGLRRSGAETLLADFALAAMAVSVILEIAAYSVAGGAAQAAARGANQSTIVGIDAAAKWLDLNVIAPFSVAILVASFAMLRSRLFPAWVCWLGLAAGIVGCVDGLIAGPAFRAGVLSTKLLSYSRWPCWPPGFGWSLPASCCLERLVVSGHDGPSSRAPAFRRDGRIHWSPPASKFFASWVAGTLGVGVGATWTERFD